MRLGSLFVLKTRHIKRLIYEQLLATPLPIIQDQAKTYLVTVLTHVTLKQPPFNWVANATIL